MLGSSRAFIFIAFLSQIFCIFGTNIILLNMEQSSLKQIDTYIKFRPKGRIYFSGDFVHFGTPEAVKKSLMRLEKAERLIRLGRGIYYYPKIDKKLGLGIIYPTLEEIACSIAQRDKARIVPTGVYALNKLGISTQIPMNVVYLTDGTQRIINIGVGKKITFKHTTPRNLAFKSELFMLIVSALREIGQKNVTKELSDTICQLVLREEKKMILSDLELAPAWIRKLIINFYGSQN